MDLVDGMRTFVQVVSEGSFTNAGDRLGISKKLVSKYIGQLEDRLGCRLLYRTTRTLSLTEIGHIYHQRCLQIIDDLDELELTVQSQVINPRGRLYVSAPTTFGEIHLVPRVKGFREKYPDVTIEFSFNDRYVNLVDEGFDVAIRIGNLKDSSYIARKLAPAKIVLCAAPAYLERMGIPSHPEELTDHDCILDTNFRSGTKWPFIIDDKNVDVSISWSVAVNSARSARDYARQGGGIAMCPAYVVGPDIKAGKLVPLLEGFGDFDLNIFAVYNNARNLAPKVRAFVDYMVEEFREHATWDSF